MKKYNVKYETYSDNCKIVETTAYSKSHAISKLYDMKELYWITVIGKTE